MTKKSSKTTKTSTTDKPAEKHIASAAPETTAEAAANGKDEKKAPKTPTWVANLKPRKVLVEALVDRDEQKVARYRNELAADREKRLALFDTMYSILERPEFKSNSKPGMALVRVLVNEYGMSQFTANNRWQEFKSLVLNGEAE
ncbi:MAG: hypothetical protein ACE14L_05230 [Terriglobales bacterium]